MDKYLKANKKLWDDLTKIHYESDFYDVEGFKKGNCSLTDIEVEEVGDVTGKSLLHLQCHFGQDTLSWARRGADVTGVDFSEKGINQAISLAKELDIPAKFIRCDIYELDKNLDDKFDIVFTSAGVLIWLPDSKRWAEIISHFLKPKGIFYIREFHPFTYIFNDEAETPIIGYPYFKTNKPIESGDDVDYANPNIMVEGTSYEWPHSMAEIINSLINAGLKIEFLHEFNYSVCQLYSFLKKCDDGMWRYDGAEGDLPLMFSIRAIKK